LGQNGANPRPAGRPLSCLALKLCGEFLEPEVEPLQDGFCTIHELRPKGLDHVKWRSKPETTRRIRAQFNLGSNMGLESNKSVQRRAEESQREAGRPSTCKLCNYATVTDSRRRSQTSTQRRWPDGHTPKPPGLGEAGWPHFAAPQVSASHGS